MFNGLGCHCVLGVKKKQTKQLHWPIVCVPCTTRCLRERKNLDAGGGDYFIFQFIFFFFLNRWDCRILNSKYLFWMNWWFIYFFFFFFSWLHQCQSLWLSCPDDVWPRKQWRGWAATHTYFGKYFFFFSSPSLLQ